MKHTLTILLLTFTLFASAQFNHQRVYSTFDNLPLAKADTFNNGADTSGGFLHADRLFNNNYNFDWNSYTGFALSNMTDDTTRGFMNQYSAITGSGLSGTSNYLVGYQSAHIKLAEPTDLSGAYFTNGTYGYYEMLEGGFSKKFGGASGAERDSFKLIITSYLNNVVVAEAELFLADFTTSDKSNDYILKDWKYLDFNNDEFEDETIDSIVFSFQSSDTGQYGINTPAYFMMDDFNAISNSRFPETLIFDADTFDNGSNNVGGFILNHMYFRNNYNKQWNSWSGWSVSSMYDSIDVALSNQYSAVAGEKPTFTGNRVLQPFHMVNSAQYNEIRAPHLDDQYEGNSIFKKLVANEPTQVFMAITNSTYAYHDMINGSGFSKVFGGASGTDPDYFRVVMYGVDKADSLLYTDTIYLADFRSDVSENDYILKDWVYFQPKKPCNKIKFKLESSDVGMYGMNTPSYFCLGFANNFPAAINDVDALQVNVYPNPTRSSVTISSATKMNNYEVFNMSGQIVLKGKVSGSKHSIDVNNLTQGVYFVSVNTDNGMSTQKFIKH